MPNRKAEQRIVKPLMQKQFCERSRVKSAPDTCKPLDWHTQNGLYHSATLSKSHRRQNCFV